MPGRYVIVLSKSTEHQPVIIMLGLDIGERKAKRGSGGQRRSKFVGDGGVELAQGEGGHPFVISRGRLANQALKTRRLIPNRTGLQGSRGDPKRRGEAPLIGFVEKGTTMKSRPATVAAGIRGSRTQNSGTTWTPALR